MKKEFCFCCLVMPALVKAQDVMTETRQELTSPDGAYRFYLLSTCGGRG